MDAELLSERWSKCHLQCSASTRLHLVAQGERFRTPCYSTDDGLGISRSIGTCVGPLGNGDPAVHRIHMACYHS
jgi:hypothetical protein